MPIDSECVNMCQGACISLISTLKGEFSVKQLTEN